MRMLSTNTDRPLDSVKRSTKSDGLNSSFVKQLYATARGPSLQLIEQMSRGVVASSFSMTKLFGFSRHSQRYKIFHFSQKKQQIKCYSCQQRYLLVQSLAYVVC